jgi:hypothetical protein
VERRYWTGKRIRKGKGKESASLDMVVKRKCLIMPEINVSHATHSQSLH